jgi:hypothetical protein
MAVTSNCERGKNRKQDLKTMEIHIISSKYVMVVYTGQTQYSKTKVN